MSVGRKPARYRFARRVADIPTFAGNLDTHHTIHRCKTLRVLWLYFYAFHRKLQPGMREIFNLHQRFFN
jgi:hypothetical protein